MVQFLVDRLRNSSSPDGEKGRGKGRCRWRTSTKRIEIPVQENVRSRFSFESDHSCSSQSGRPVTFYTGCRADALGVPTRSKGGRVGWAAATGAPTSELVLSLANSQAAEWTLGSGRIQEPVRTGWRGNEWMRRGRRRGGGKAEEEEVG